MISSFSAARRSITEGSLLIAPDGRPAPKRLAGLAHFEEAVEAEGEQVSNGGNRRSDQVRRMGVVRVYGTKKPNGEIE